MHQGSPEFHVACCHEAGHIVAGWLMGITVSKVEVTKTGIELSLNLQQGLHRTYFASWEHIKKFIRFLLAGKQAEVIFFGCASVSAWEDDYSRARRTALDYAKQNEVEKLEQETRELLVGQRDAMSRVATAIKLRSELSSFDLRVLYMDWLARGKR